MWFCKYLLSSFNKDNLGNWNCNYKVGGFLFYVVIISSNVDVWGGMRVCICCVDG